ncbi:hypothetical protein SZN_29782 [Streptomyces zinciresistens K42]|uniref:Uncharacterized protein n=1 Tax=Streptomyces zinciresistens K42 TaxID=700597 RepID=G2GKB3_9ACTN|nr:hypothetical protein [Streptomyces zinciresistens]EGX56057.1 hypothetical protein SZN_29782 [Streptomyces zinciresistens K42]
MVSGTHTAHAIETTAESLQADLARLETQKQALERELAAVVAHLCSVRRALGALRPLLTAPDAAIPDQARTAAHADPRAADPRAAADSAKPASRSAGSPAAKGRGRAGTAGASTAGTAAADPAGAKAYGRLTEQIMQYFAGAGDTDVRARDVAAALGRDTDSGSINAVRSTLDRLVAASRVRRTGRGLYRAGP